MHRFLMILPLVAALPACSTTATTQPAETAMPAAPFVMPMDPGTLACSTLSNPAALAEATDWTMGKVRAAAMAGRVVGVADAGSVRETLASYCRANPNSSLAAATRAANLV